MQTSEVIECFGGRKATATALSKTWRVTPEAISQWGEYPPLGRQYQIEAMTKGKLKAERIKKEKKTA